MNITVKAMLGILLNLRDSKNKPAQNVNVAVFYGMKLVDVKQSNENGKLLFGTSNPELTKPGTKFTLKGSDD